MELSGTLNVPSGAMNKDPLTTLIGTLSAILLDGGVSPAELHSFLSGYEKEFSDAIVNHESNIMNILTRCTQKIIKNTPKTENCLNFDIGYPIVDADIKNQSKSVGVGASGEVFVLSNNCYGDDYIAKVTKVGEGGVTEEEVRFNLLFSLIGVAPFVLAYYDRANVEVIIQERIIPQNRYMMAQKEGIDRYSMPMNVVKELVVTLNRIHALGYIHDDLHMLNMGRFIPTDDVCLIDFGETRSWIESRELISDYKFMMNCSLVRSVGILNHVCFNLVGKGSPLKGLKEEEKQFMKGLTVYPYLDEIREGLKIHSDKRSNHDDFVNDVIILSALRWVVYSKMHPIRKANHIRRIFPKRRRGLPAITAQVILGVILASTDPATLRSLPFKEKVYPLVDKGAVGEYILAPMTFASTSYYIKPKRYMYPTLVRSHAFQKMLSETSGHSISDNGAPKNVHFLLSMLGVF